MADKISPVLEEIHTKLFGGFEHHKVRVYNWEDFEDWYNSEEAVLGGGYAIIEIYTSPGKPIIEDKVREMFPTFIIALDFEDMPEDVDFPDSSYHPLHPTITYEQAEQLVRFIDWNMKIGNDFIIHCGAGVSRSQQVAEYIMLVSHQTYEYDYENSTHNHYFFQTIVLSRLLEVKHTIFPDFHNRDNLMVYDHTLRKWVARN